MEPGIRERLAAKIKELKARRIPLEFDCVWGKPLESDYYFGCTDTCSGAGKRFETLMKKYPKHLCYSYGGMNSSGPNLLQQYISG